MSLPRSEIKEYIIKRLTVLRCVRASIGDPSTMEWTGNICLDFVKLADAAKWHEYDAKIQELERLYRDAFETVEMTA